MSNDKVRESGMKKTVTIVAVFVFGLFTLIGFVGLMTIAFAESPGWGFLALLFVGVFGLSYPRLFEFLENEP